MNIMLQHTLKLITTLASLLIHYIFIVIKSP